MSNQNTAVISGITGQEKLCPECSNEFTVKNLSKRQMSRIFCSKHCAIKNNGKRNKGKTHTQETKAKQAKYGADNPFYGKTHSDETKTKISQSNFGRKYSEETNRKKAKYGTSNHFYGKKHSEESKKLISEHHRDSKGENNPMYQKGYLIEKHNNPAWKGGVSFEEYGTEFNAELKTKIRKRDFFTCKVCNKKGFVVHHIDYVKMNNKECNLVTLCVSCHAKTNFNREKWIAYFCGEIS